MKKKWNMVGGRVIKTGIVVFLTVLVCELFYIPAIFAVITAIVTIGTTATDSIKNSDGLLSMYCYSNK